MEAASLHAVHANESHGLWARATDPVAQMVPAPLGLPCRKRPPAFRSPPSGRDAVATLVPAASPAGRTGQHGFRSRTDCLTLRPNYIIDSMSVTTPAATERKSRVSGKGGYVRVEHR